MKIVIACPIRSATGDENIPVHLYIAGLKAQGHEVFSYWDTLGPDCPTGADILYKHMEAVRRCDELHVFWKETSTGIHWEVGQAVALGKKIVIMDAIGWNREGQSYLTALCQDSDVEWRVPGIERPQIEYMIQSERPLTERERIVRDWGPMVNYPAPKEGGASDPTSSPL